ncbi:MAG: hypothetical protein J6J16_01160 [Lachnospiraceae bacterium]|nr:hypothetical protein [Lachnospiraceae bacterium]
MRITNQMLNESARKAGLDLNRPTLLDYMNKNSNNTLYSALSKANQSTSDLMKKSNYEKLEKSSNELVDILNRLSDDGEEGLFSTAKKENDYKEIYNTIEKLINSYNNIIDNSKYITGTLESFYTKMLKEIPSEDSELLNSVGITVTKDDKIEFNSEKLKLVDTETLEKVFGNDSEFITKLAYVTSKIADNAEANVESLSSSYNQTGNIYSSVKNKYDFWG